MGFFEVANRQEILIRPAITHNLLDLCLVQPGICEISWSEPRNEIAEI